jgi:flagellar assembly protein FliH
LQTAKQTARKQGFEQVELLQYPDGSEAGGSAFAGLRAPPMWEGWASPTDDLDDAPDVDPLLQGQLAAEAALRAEFEKRVGEEAQRAFERGAEQGRLDGRQMERQAQAQAVALAWQQRTQQAAELVDSFRRERDLYLERIEREVVKLALAVAARILRREAQMDPLLLTGAVRVALGQLSGTTAVTLRVPPAELSLWTESMALAPNLPLRPRVVAGEAMRLGDCLIETELGSVDLGIRSQLGEIERGFFDRAGQPMPPSSNGNPAASHGAAAMEPLP